MTRIALFLLTLSLLIAGCDHPKPAKANFPTGSSTDVVAVKTTPARVESVDLTVDVVGTMYGDEQTTISSKVAGRVVKLYKDFGDRVGEGDKLGEIDRTDYELSVAQKNFALMEALAKIGLTALPDEKFDPSTIATVQRAKVQSENARAKLERARQLFEQKPPLLSDQDFADIETAYEVSQRDYDVSLLQARADLAAARSRASEVANAQQRLDDTTIIAPTIGDKPSADRFAVSRRYVNNGSYVKEADRVFDLVADDPIKFRAMVPESYTNEVKIGQIVRVQVAGSKTAVEGKVSRTNPTIDSASRTFEVEALIANSDHRLRPGAFARASIFIGQDPKTIFVPRAAISSFAGTDKVFSVTDGKAVEHRIQQGVARGDWVQVLSGMDQPGEVVVEGMAKLARGTPVKASPTTAPGQ